MLAVENQEMQQAIIGKVANVVFQDNNNGFTIINIKKKHDGYKTVKGYHLPTAKNILFKFIGVPVYKKGKRYFEVSSFENAQKEQLENDDKDKLITYISSGLYPGIGPKTAQAIIERFGNKSIDIIENHTSMLSEIKGISAAKISKLKETIESNQYLQELKKELMQYDISADSCVKLATLYGKDALSKIRENPYRLIHDIRMSFQDADEIANKMGIDKNADIRLDAAFKHVINYSYALGNTGIELQTFGNSVYKLLNQDVSKERINARFHEYLQNKKYRHARLEIDGDCYEFIFTNNMFNKEKEISECIVRLKKNTIEPIENIQEKIKQIEEQKGITLDPIQKQAVETGLEEPLVIITGGPGTGKTTIMEFITSIYEKETEKEAILLAPTGKAARKLAEYTGHTAKTIHSQFNVYDLDTEIERLRIEDITDRLVIVDEFSMVDTITAHLLLTHIKDGSRVILVGDIDQLPSVGPGAVLRDIINSNICPVIRLERIFRTKEKSLIYNNTQNVNHGIRILKTGKEFQMFKESELEKCKILMAERYLKRVAEYGIEGTVLLLPYRKEVGGVEDMNKYLQEIVNPPSESKPEVVVNGTVYRVGDPVMHVKCNTPEASNGDTGIIKNVVDIDGDIQVKVLMNGKLLTYDRSMLSNLELAYAMTIHKSQGSEYPAVITCITENHSAMLYRNIPYVAFSRGKNVVDVIYDDGLFKAIKTQKSDTRITLLHYFLKRAQGDIIYDI